MAAHGVLAPGATVQHVSDVIPPPRYTEAVQIYVWRNSNPLKLYLSGSGHAGHAAMRVYKNGAAEQFISWWPGRRARGVAHRRLSLDAMRELGELTKQRLPDPTRGLPGQLQPRAGQYFHDLDMDPEIIEDMDEIRSLWMQLPEAVVSLPGMGARGSYWGLHIASISEWWKNWSRQSEYEMRSTTNNCSGAVAQGLIRGGAECFVRAPHPWIVITPKDVAEWGEALRDRFFNLEFMTGWLKGQVTDGHIPMDRYPLPKPLPTLEEWKRATFLERKPRSLRLRVVDSALEEYGKYLAQEFSFDKHRRLVKLVEALYGHARERPQSDRNAWILKLAKLTLEELEGVNDWNSNFAI